MFQLYIKKKGGFAPNLKGEYLTIEEARAALAKAKAKDDTISYTIEETNGGVNSYGELLTEHQQKIYSEAVFNDMSLSELSEEEGISRQGIHDLIKRVDRQLEGYENKLKLVEKFKDIKKDVMKVEKMIDECEHNW